MQITTWNVNSIKVRLPHLLEFLEEEKPVVVGLQEIKSVTAEFPSQEIEALGYHTAVFGQKTYNGVALLSREPIEDIVEGIPNFKEEEDEARVIAGTVLGIRIINIYAVNGQSPESDRYLYKLKWYQALLDYIKAEEQRYPELIVIGDYNIAPADEDVHNPKSWEGKILCTEKERALYRQFLALGYVDAIRLFSQPADLYTWWDYRRQGFEKNHGLRIDHLLASRYLSRRIKGAKVHLDIRAKERPSDHAPVSVVLSY